MDHDAADSAATQNLLRQARQGDQGAVDQLFDRHRAYLGQFVELRLDRRLRARVDPADIVQEAYLEAVRRFTDYLERPGLPFRLWLRQIANDRLLMARRYHLGAARRTVGREVALPAQSSWLLAQRLLAAGSTPSNQVNRRELARRVRQAVEQLAEGDREMLLLRNFEGLSNQEAAHLLGIDPAAASQRYGRALLRLRKLLLDSGFSEATP